MNLHDFQISGVRCSRKYRFEAAHNEFRGDFSEKENSVLFGHHTLIHGHNYELYVLLEDELDHYSKMVVELGSIDSIVNGRIIDNFDHEYLKRLISPHTHEFFTQKCSSILEDVIPHYYGIILVEEVDRIYAHVSKTGGRMIHKTHVFKFSAAHKLFNPELFDAENEEVFGKCQRLHGHNYTLSVTMKGDINTVSGKIITDRDFDVLINQILTKYDYQQLHELEEFNGTIPTTEVFIKVLWDEIKEGLGYRIFRNLDFSGKYWSKNLELDCLALQETDRNVFIYRGEV